jgi:hypothetical protein
VFFVGPGAATALPTTVEGVRICGNRFISCGPSNSFIVSFVGGSDGPVSVNTTLSDVEVINNTFSATNSKLGVIQVDGFGCLSNVLFAQNVVVANSAFYDNLPMLVSYAPGTAAKVRFQDNLWVNASPGPLKCAFEYLPPEYMVTMDTLFGQYAAITAGCRAQIQSLWVTNTPLSGLGLTKSHGTGSLTATLNHLPPSAVADVAAPPAPNEPAPALVDEASFLGDSRSRVYPRASAERWGPLPSGRSMLLQTLDAQSGLQGGGTSSIPFSFTLRSTANRVVVVEACTNLTNPAWVPLATNNITGVSAYFSDPQSASYAARYYRLRLP